MSFDPQWASQVAGQIDPSLIWQIGKFVWQAIKAPLTDLGAVHRNPNHSDPLLLAFGSMEEIVSPTPMKSPFLDVLSPMMSLFDNVWPFPWSLQSMMTLLLNYFGLSNDVASMMLLLLNVVSPMISPSLSVVLSNDVAL